MDDLAGFLFVVALVLSFLSGAVIEGKSHKEKALKVLGQSVEEVSKLKEQCEYSLPRNRECKLVISYETQEKK